MRNKKAKFLVLWLVGTLLISGLATPVRATAYSLRLVTTIDIGGVNEKAKVKQIFTVNGADKKALPAAAMIGVMGADLAGLTAKSEDGAKLSVNFLPEEQSIKVDLPKTKLKSTKPWSFTINYSAVVLSEFGAVKATQLPATTTNLDITSQTTTVLADLDLGFAVVRGHPVSKTGVGVGQQILTFTDKGPMSKSALIVFGDSTFVTVSQTTTLKNNSWWWKNLTLTLPPDTNQQMARLKSITPEPSNVRLDKDGNMVAEFRLGPLASRDVEVKTEVAVSGLSYSLENAVNIDQADPLLIERYTRLTDVWQPAGLEIAAAQDDTAADVVEKVFAAVVAEAAAGLDSTELLNVAARNASLELSDRLVGELRHRGVPAREALGLIMTDGNRLLAEPKPHAWVEAFVAGTGWITLDPWLGVLSGQFGGADPVRVALALWGLADDRPPVELDSASLEFTATGSGEQSNELTVTARKFMFLPFVSVFSVNTHLGLGNIVDGVTISTDGNSWVLGSMAPLQLATSRRLVFGSAAIKNQDVALSIAGSDEPATQTVSSTSYLPLIIELGLAAIVWLLIRFKKHRSGGRRLKRSHEALTLHDEAVGGDIESENLVRLPDSLPAPTGTTQPETKSHRPPKLIQ